MSSRTSAALLAGLLTLSVPMLAAAGGDASKGKVAFEANCASCHGVGGKGDGPVGVMLTPTPRDLSSAEFKFDADGDGTLGSDGDVSLVIKNGAAAYGGSPMMTAWPTFGDGDLADLVAHIRTLAE